MYYTITTVKTSGHRSTKFVSTASVTDANVMFFNLCAEAEGGDVQMMTMHTGRTRIAFQSFENGRML